MKITFFFSDFLTRGRKARETRRGATVLKLISSAKASRSLKFACYGAKIMWQETRGHTDPRIWSMAEGSCQHC